MKIDANTPSAVSLSKPRQPRPANTAPATGSGTANETTLSLSASLSADAAGAPIDSQRIAEIRQSIADGRMRINPERIADRLIEGVREQLAKDRKP